MSTKMTIACTDEFSLYEDYMENEDLVFLEYDKPYGQRVALRIPKHVWEYLRRFPAISFDLVDKNEKELFEKAEKLTEHRKNMPFLNISESQTTEEYILDLYESLKQDKQEQIELLKKISELRAKDTTSKIYEDDYPDADCLESIRENVLEKYINNTAVSFPIRYRHGNFEIITKYV